MTTTTTVRRCIECERLFDLANEIDAEEFAYGHDCEEPLPSEYWHYVFEIRELLSLPKDANVRDELMTSESGPETPEERLGTIRDIFAFEEWDWPEHLL